MLTGYTFNAIRTLRTGHIVLLSDNAFLWLGLQSLVSTMLMPRPDIDWISAVTPANMVRLRERVMESTDDSGWLVFTDAVRVNDVQVYLPPARVSIMADTLPIAQFLLHLRNGHCPRESVPDASLTRSELRVCRLLSLGIAPVHIAKLLNKSPKTIYTHKRNAMSKFHCRTLAEFHRKICLLGQHANPL